MTTEPTGPSEEEVVAAGDIGPVLRTLTSELVRLRRQLSEMRQTLDERERQLDEARQGRVGSEHAAAALNGVLTDMVLEGRTELQEAQDEAKRSMNERLAAAQADADALVADAAAALATALGRAIDLPLTPTSPPSPVDHEPPIEAGSLADMHSPYRPRQFDAPPVATEQPGRPPNASSAPDGHPPPPAAPPPPPPWPPTASPPDKSARDAGSGSGPTPPAYPSPASSGGETVASSFASAQGSNGQAGSVQVLEYDLDEQFTRVVGLKPNTAFRTPPHGTPAVKAAPESSPSPPASAPEATSAPPGPPQDAFDAFWPKTAAVQPAPAGRLGFSLIDVLLPIVALTLIVVVVLSWLA